MNTGVRTTFRTDNSNGQGEGALVFAYAVPAAKRRSVRQTKPQPPSTSLTLRLRAYCWKQYILCKYQKCNYPCVSGIQSKLLNNVVEAHCYVLQCK